MPKPSTQTPKTDELAQQVSDKIADQHSELTNRNWAEINSVMEDDEDREIILSFKTTITNRPAEPGNVASRDSRIVTVLAYSKGRNSDKTESPFPDPTQPELPAVADPDL